MLTVRDWETVTDRPGLTAGWGIDYLYGLVSLWVMLSNFAHAWVHLWGRLRDCEDAIDRHIHSFRAHGLLGDPGAVPLSPLIASEIFDILREIRPHAQHLGLAVSLDSMRRLFERIHQDYQGSDTPTAMEVQQRLHELREQVEVELRSRAFYFVPSHRVFLYDREELFGPTVAQNFGKAAFHIREAGSCLALGRATASVFHLMCVLEVALDSLAHHVGLPYSEKNWGTILDDIDSQIQKIALGKIEAPPDWDKTWSSQVAIEFFHFKEAWRNHTSHGRAKYTEEEARRIFEHIKAFMEQLAVRIRERP